MCDGDHLVWTTWEQMACIAEVVLQDMWAVAQQLKTLQAAQQDGPPMMRGIRAAVCTPPLDELENYFAE